MDSDSDDDVPDLASLVQQGGHNAPAVPNTELNNSVDSGGAKQSSESGPSANIEEPLEEDEFRHPAARGVLVPQKMLKQANVHPGAVEAIVRDAKEASELKEQGNLHFKNGQFRLAEEAYTEALLRAPLSADFDYSRAVYHGNRGACYLKMTLYDKCIADCTEAIALSPKYVKVIMRRAKAHELKENLEAALEDVKMVLEIDPSYVTARNEALRLEKEITEKQEKMKEEVLGKLKSLGNTILGKFGLSLDNFKMTKDENGGMSLNFQQ